jgi:hypothetical protein
VLGKECLDAFAAVEHVADVVMYAEYLEKPA